ncbi:MAG: TonB family protein [Pseudomonadales bacterium]
MTIRILNLLFLFYIVSAHHATAQPAADNLSLNGLAVHAQLRNDVYMGAVYTEVGSSNEQMLLESDQNKRMELRVLAKRWSARGFSEHWNQALIINNSEQDLAKFAREIRQFTSAIRGKLIPGDKISIDYSVKQHTRLSVDGVQLLSVSNDPLQFFQLLLRCWVGPRPPSSEFKYNILNLPTGENGNGLMARYEALLPVSGRNKTILAWREGNSQAAALAAITAAARTKTNAAQSTPKAEQPEKVTTQDKAAPKNTAPESAQTPAANQETNIVATPDASQTTASAKDAPVPAAATAATDVTVPANTASRDAQPTTSPQASLTESQTEAINTPAEQTIVEQTAKAAAPTEPRSRENGLLSLYKSNLLKRVYGFVIYPERAIDRNQEGTVVLQVTVNRKGKVLNIKNDEPSRYRLLNSAATRAIKKASPFPAAPRKLKGSKFDLEFPIVFRIPRS